MPKQLTALILFLICSLWAYSNTITVTSNADSGPGTLRDAISTANNNGTTVLDSIVFNIPSSTEAGRTISLQSEFPVLSSNIIIDGSTQPSAVLGISGAKITLYLDHFTAVPFNFLFINNASNVKIFGLCFRYFDNPDAGSGFHYAIVLRNSRDITIGAPGKGNLFSLVRAAITNNYWNYYSDSVRNLTVQGNVFGLNSQNNIAHRGYIELIRATNITIGGPTPEEGNIFVGTGVQVSQTGAVNSAFFLKFQNNKFCLDWTGSQYYLNEGASLTVSGYANDDTSVTKTFILDNVFSGSWPGGIGLSGLNHKALFKGNKVGMDITGTVCKNGYYNSLGVLNCKYVEVGGYTPAEENIFSGAVYTQRRGTNLIKNQFGTIGISQAANAGDPFIKIVGYDNGVITGKSNPNAKIQLYTNSCDLVCINRSYLTTVYSDANGNWSYNYSPNQPNIVATATTADSSTTEFTGPKLNHDNIKISHAACGKSYGSVTGFVITEGTHIRWVNTNTGEVVSTDTNLVNMPAGRYEIRVSNGENGCAYAVAYTIEDFNPPPAIAASITDASCGKSNGVIYTMADYYHLSIKWLNASGDSIGQYKDKYNLPPGTYYLKGWVPEDSSCNKTYGPFVVKNLTGSSLNTDNVQVTPSVCGNSNGSIKGIIAENATGAVFLQWVDSLNRITGNTYDLLNVPPGKYRLKFKDAGNCDTIITSYFILPNTGAINVDTSARIIKASNCSGPTGSIYGIKATGASQYQWTDVANNNTIGNDIDAFNLSSGRYQLTMSNSYGCSLSLPPVFVPQSAFTTIGVTGVSFLPDLCFQNNGHVKIMSFNNDSTLFQFRWVDSATQQIAGRGTQLDHAKAGTYYVWAKDTNQCEKMIYTHLIIGTPFPVMNTSSMQVKDDHCELKQGSVSSLQVTGLYGPTTYTWYNENNQAVGNTIDLKNAGAASYTLKVVDAGVCTVQSPPVIIKDITDAVEPPRYNDLVIPRYSDAVLTPVNTATGTYYLVGAPGSQQQNNSGSFTIKSVSSDTAVNIVKQYGTCTSATVTVNIKVVDKSWFAIPTAFTPNGDGKNDWLHVKVIGYLQLSYFRVYNRWGQLVFETRKVNDGWDGRYSGQLQDTGAYVWVAEGKDIKGNTVNGRGSFVLIR